MKTALLNRKLDETKDAALNRVLIVILFVMTFGIIISMLRMSQTGFTINYGVQIFLAGVVVFLYTMRRKLSTTSKGVIFLSVLYVMAISGLLSFGLYGFGYAYFIPASAIAFLYFNKKTGWRITLSSLFVIIFIGGLFNQGILDFVPAQGYMQSTAMWLNMVITLSLISIVVTMFWSNMYSMLVNTFTQINYQQQDMKKMNAELLLAKDKAELSDRLKSSFLQNISHEIRTPLNIIIGFSDMLSHTNDTEEQQEFNLVIRDNSNKMLKIVNDIVDFSTIETNSFSLNNTEFDIIEVLDNVEKQLSLRNKKPISIVIDKTRGLIKADKERFQQIITNLLDNALMFTDAGEVVLKVETSDDFFRFTITDTGIGISETEQQKIFDRFYKVNNFSGGAGLGLSISKSIAGYMGGDVRIVKSKPGEGSVFEFKLPSII